MKFLIRNILLVMIILGLSACAVSEKPDTVTSSKITCWSIFRKNQQPFLIQSGAQIQQTKDTLLIIFPTDRLFTNSSSIQLSSNAGDILESLADFLKCYEKASVKIVAFNNTFKQQDKNRLLSFEQAKIIMSNLYSNGMKKDTLFAISGDRGKVNDKIESNRIEFFVKLYPIG